MKGQVRSGKPVGTELPPAWLVPGPGGHPEGSWQSSVYRSARTRARWAQGFFVAVGVALAWELVLAAQGNQFAHRWSEGGLAQGTQFETRPRYTPTTTFETFPFPRSTDTQRNAIAEAARDLDRLRNGWLNPSGLSDADLTKRTLTNLYNARPTWLAQAHERLDAAVLVAYGWPADIESEDLLGRLLALNLARAAGEATAG